MKTRRRCAPPFFRYPRKTWGGGVQTPPPPAGRGLTKRYFTLMIISIPTHDVGGSAAAPQAPNFAFWNHVTVKTARIFLMTLPYFFLRTERHTLWSIWTGRASHIRYVCIRDISQNQDRSLLLKWLGVGKSSRHRRFPRAMWPCVIQFSVFLVCSFQNLLWTYWPMFRLELDHYWPKGKQVTLGFGGGSKSKSPPYLDSCWHVIGFDFHWRIQLTVLGGQKLRGAKALFGRFGPKAQICRP